MENGLTFAWADGVLHINLSGTEMRICWTPAPLAEERRNNSAWREFWPEFRLLRPPEESVRRANEVPFHVPGGDAQALEEKRQAFDGFREAVPANIVAAAERFGSHQWALLRLLQAEQAALDLAVSNPILAYCLANNCEFRGTNQSPAAVQAAIYCRRKQRWIAKWLGFPENEAVVKLLKRIAPEAASPSLLRSLRSVLQKDEEAPTLLAHFKSINAGVLELVADPRLRPYITTKLIAEVAENPDNETTLATAGVLFDAVRLLTQIAPERQVAPFESIARIMEFGATMDAEYVEHQRRIEEAKRVAKEAAERQRLERAQAGRRVREREQKDHALRASPFPAPPLPGTTEVVPISTEIELYEEGRLQHNCVGSYGYRIRRGNVYVYRVLFPQRATLSIFMGSDGCWHREQLRCDHNHGVRVATKRLVDNWLESHRVSV